MEKIVALYETMSVADAVVQDLEVARIPSVVIHRGNLERRDDSRKRSHGWPSVTVAVDEMHAVGVAGILKQYGPLEIEELVAQGHQR